jgi:branched-chain amino acid aminotransferase
MGKDIHIPVGEGGVGAVAKAMLQRIQDIQLGRVEHPWSVLVEDLVK